MVNANFATGGTIGVDLTAASTAATYALGQIVQGNGGKRWKYVQCNSTSAITQYDVVGVDENHKAYPLTKARADDGWAVAFAQNAFAAERYGFVALDGPVTARVGAGCVVDVALYTSSTAGVLDDSSTSQTKIDGVVAATAAAATAVTAVTVIATAPKSTTF